MFKQFQTLIQSNGPMKTATDGDCFFDTMHKVTGLYTKRGWRQMLGKKLWKKKVFTQKEYDHYMYTHEWADYPTVYEAVRYLQQPFCVVQPEYPNTVMLIRPDKVDWKQTNIVYLIYDSGNHFTSFLKPVTPPELVKRLITMERVDMHEEVDELIVTHGKLFDLVYDTVKETNIENFMRRYEDAEALRLSEERKQSRVSRQTRRTKSNKRTRKSHPR